MPNDIEFSQHSLLKIEILSAHGVDVTKEFVENIVRTPDKIDEGYKGRLIAQKGFDDTHVLRVIYETLPDKIYVINRLSGKEDPI